MLAPIVAIDSAQPGSRMALAAALAEHGTVDVSAYPLGVDRALYKGNLRSDKPPGQPLLAIPAYVVSRALGAESASRRRGDGNLGLWAVTLFSCVLPFMVLLVLMRPRTVAVFDEHATVPIVLALGFGTLMLPYAVNLFGHLLAAALVFGAWSVLDRAQLTAVALAFAGLLAGLAVSVEYQTGIIAIVLFVFAAVVARLARRLVRPGRRCARVRPRPVSGTRVRCSVAFAVRLLRRNDQRHDRRRIRAARPQPVRRGVYGWPWPPARESARHRRSDRGGVRRAAPSDGAAPRDGWRSPWPFRTSSLWPAGRAPPRSKRRGPGI